MGDADELLHRPARHPGRVASDARAQLRRDRQRRLSQLRSFSQTPRTIDYGAAKAALVNLSKSLAQEFGPHGIRVNCVSPGQVSTDLWLGEHGVAETVAKATGVDADTVREARRIGNSPPALHDSPRRSPR